MCLALKPSEGMSPELAALVAAGLQYRSTASSWRLKVLICSIVPSGNSASIAHFRLSCIWTHRRTPDFISGRRGDGETTMLTEKELKACDPVA